MDLQTFCNKIPKIELHCHLKGTVRAKTFVELAKKHRIPLPPYDQPEDLYYEFKDFYDFLKMYGLISESLRDRTDFQRIAYEAQEDAAKCGIRYRELSFSPMVHLDLGVSFYEALGGIVDGIHDAEKDFGIQGRVIVSINRMETPEKAVELVEIALQDKPEDLIGIGMGYAEAGNPPEKHWKAFRIAQSAGLHLTAHACEDGPPRNVETCLDLLCCERIDHGYQVVEDEEITIRCRDDGVIFTVCPTTSSKWPGRIDFASHPIRDMVEQGLKIMINSDDPPMYGTDLGLEYLIMAEKLGVEVAKFEELVMNSIEGSWLDESTKRQWQYDWSCEIRDLMVELDEQ